jgi:serine/threonine protein kinase
MGAVYLAEDTELQRRVAVKVPTFPAGEKPELLERFYREARSAATLHHPNICPVYDIGEHEGTRYITMGYLRGPPLSNLIGSEKIRSQHTVVRLVRKIALALAAAHAKGIVHRDLKPANILLDERGEPVVTDFGLARRLGQAEDSRLTQEGTILGTPAYMAPEQVTADPNLVGPACDLYSLGVILYELLTGQLPYRGSITAVLARIIQGTFPRPREHRPDLDPRLEAICLKLMARTPQERYASAAEAVGVLDHWLLQASPARVASQRSPALPLANAPGSLPPTAAPAPPAETLLAPLSVVTDPVASPPVISATQPAVSTAAPVDPDAAAPAPPARRRPAEGKP